MESRYDCLIVGAGISGISFAHYLHSIGKRVVILEKESRIGGQIETHYSQNDFWNELGAHTCYNSYVSLLELAHSVNFEGIAPKSDGQKSGYPYKLHTKDNRIDKISAHIPYMSILARCYRLFTTSKIDKSVREYYSRVFGTRAYDRVFSKFFRAVLSQNPDNYPAQLLMKRRKTRQKEHPRKLSFNKGLYSLLTSITQSDGFEVKLSSEVVSVRYLEDKELYEVHTSAAGVYYCNSLAVATPAEQAGKLLADQQPAMAQNLFDIKAHYSDTLSVVVKKARVEHIPLLAGLITLTDDFLSAISGDLTEHASLRAFAFHFEKNVEYNKKIEIICRVLGIDKADIEQLTASNHVLPALEVPNLGMKEKIDSCRINHNTYVLGNYFDGVSLEDCVNRSLDEFERYKMGH